MKYYLVTLVFICSMCNKKKSPGEEFEGRFKGSTNGINATANLTSLEGKLAGSVEMNGQPAEISGKIDEKESWGTLHDEATGKKYKYEGEVNKDELTISITFPELNDRVVTIKMQRQKEYSERGKQSDKTVELDEDLVGTWKYTEMLGGNGTETMTNESFMEFTRDGFCTSWPGRSSGPGYYREEDKSSASTGKWYTRENLLFFIDPATGQEASTNYTVNENGLLMSNQGAGKKAWQRVQ